MLFVAAAAMLVAACGKETDKEPVVDPYVEPAPHTDYLICDNAAYPFVRETGLGEDGFYQVVLSPADSVSDFRIELKVKDACVGRTFNLLADTAGNYSIDVRWDAETSFSYEIYAGHVYSILGGNIYEDASAVSEGVFYTCLTKEDFATELDVLLANGHRIRISTVTPADEISFLPFCGSEF